MSNWIRRKANQILDDLTSRVAGKIHLKISDDIERTIAEGLAIHQPAARSTAVQPLVIDQTTTHFFIHTSDGHRFFLDARDLHISLHVLEHGHWEDHVRDVMMQVLKPGSTFIDVGGNVGLHSVFAASIVGPTGKVFVFEPLPQMFETLKLNIDVNGLGNVITPTQMAVSDTEEIKSFSSFKSHSAMSGFSVPEYRLNNFNETAASSVETIRVKTTTLDAKFVGQQVDCIKIDVEGYEALVLRGAHHVIRNNENIALIVEWEPKLVAETLGSNTISEIISFLKTERFQPYLALWRQPLQKITWETAPSIKQGDLVVRRDGMLDNVIGR